MDAVDADDDTGSAVLGDQTHHCFSAYPLLTETTVDCATHCRSDEIRGVKACIRPASEEGILRIRFVPAVINRMEGAAQLEQVVLFAGEREAVFRDVTVSMWRPRGGSAVHSLVRWGELVFV
jgi:hypothetical protein